MNENRRKTVLLHLFFYARNIAWQSVTFAWRNDNIFIQTWFVPQSSHAVYSWHLLGETYADLIARIRDYCTIVLTMMLYLQLVLYLVKTY